MSTQKISVAGLIYNGSLPIISSPGANATLSTANEWAISTVQIAMGGSGTLTFSGNVGTITFTSAHGIIKSVIQGQNYFTMPSQNVASPYFQISGATGVTALNGVTWTLIDVPTTTTATFFTTLTGAAVVTSANFNPVYALLPGDFDFLLAGNAVIQYNPDNTGIPQGPAINPSVTGATFRSLAAVSTSGELWFDGVGQKIVLCNNGTAGTSRFSQIG
jgi:hypothetical protein